MKNIAIIGAGMAGLTLANRLHQHANVTLIEKSRGVGGRMATRRMDGYEFDHGAQFFTARSRAFKQYLSSYLDSGTITEWKPYVITLAAGEKSYTRQWFEPHYIGTPAMTGLCKKLAADQNILFKTHILRLNQAVNGWQLQTEEQPLEINFDWVISTAPAAQTGELFAEHFPQEFITGEEGLESVVMSPCFALMLAYKDLPPLPFDAAKVKDSPLEWIMLNSSKPGRAAAPTLVIQTSNSWAEQNIERTKEELIKEILSELSQLLPIVLPHPKLISLQRWRYSRVETPLKQDYLIDPLTRLAACGDWAVEGRVEGAFISAMKLADALGTLI